MKEKEADGKKRAAQAQSAALLTLPRIAQHENIHTLNVLLQQAAFSSIQARAGSKAGRLSLVAGRCHYVQSLARKATLRLDTLIKRAICKTCRALLLPGITCSIRIRPSKAADIIVITRCMACSTRRTLPCPAPTAYRFKVAARKRRKRAEHVEAKQMASKIEQMRTDSIKVQPQAAVNLMSVQQQRSISQRARRRLGRQRALAVYERTNDSLSSRKRRRTSRKIRPKAKSLKERMGVGNETTDVYQDQDTREIAKRQSGGGDGRKRRRRTKGKPVLNLVQFNERHSTTTNDKHWSQDIPNQLSEAQKSALGKMRGNHVYTVGLGRGGVVGDVHR